MPNVNMKASGMSKLMKSMVEALRSGETAVYMKDIGKTVKPMDEVDLSMPTETPIMGNGRMTSLMVTEPIRKLMEQLMRVTG